MRTLKIASVLALCGAANLAHAADIPGVLGDPGIATDTTEPNEKPETTTAEATFSEILVQEKRWATSMELDFKFSEEHWFTFVTQRCYAFTLAYDPETDKFLRTKISLERPSAYARTRSSVAELIIFYKDDDSDKAGVLVWTYEPLRFKATSQIRIGNRTLQLTNLDRHHASFTDRQNRIDLIDAIMRGRTATFSSHGPNGFIQRTFDLAGATAMAKLAAEICDASGPNPGAPKPTPTARRKQPAQPTPQSQTTTTQPRRHTQTTTHQPREEDFITDLGGQLGNQLMDQATQMLADEITNQMLGDFGF